MTSRRTRPTLAPRGSTGLPSCGSWPAIPGQASGSSLRPRRLPSGRRRLPTRPSGTRHPAAALRRADDRVARRYSRRTERATRGSSGPTIRCWPRRRSPRTRRSCGCMLLPAEWAGKRTIRYLDPADEEKPKLQRATILLEHAGRAMRRSGGKALVDQLEVHGVELAFCVPGESYLPILDALHDSPIRLISCRHEAAAANMAEAYGKLTGRPGICFVTRGPGATHASVGVHTADQDSTPMILFVGQVPRGHIGSGGVPGARLLGGVRLDREVGGSDRRRVARFPEHVARAFAVATAGRPGPVVLALPEDVLDEETDAEDAAPTEIPRPATRRRRAPPAGRASRAPPSGRSSSSARAAGRRGPARTSRSSARRTRFPSSPRFAARTTSTTARAPTPVT